MPVTEKIGRRNCIPIIYTRGTHYEVGYDVGRTFAAIINEFLEISQSLNNDFLPAYETPEGKKAYDDTLETVTKSFPQYIQELRGTADGAKVPFHKLFLLHMDNIVTSAIKSVEKEAIGCSTICINYENQEILGHSEDAASEVLNHFYFVSAHIISDKPQGRWGVTEEKFTSLCYAGHLPGYTMNYNHHGLIFSINTLNAVQLYPGKTPRHFITRALLAAENFEQAELILRDSGVGAGDGCSINFTFINQEGDRIFHNAEMGPVPEKESLLNILSITPGEHMYHTNTYLRLPVPQTDPLTGNSKNRLVTLKKHLPVCKKDVIELLSDTSCPKNNIFQTDERVATIAIGIFDCVNKTWTLYADNAKKTDPLVVLPLDLKKKSRHFLTRALLAADNSEQVHSILSDSGIGAGDGCSINFTFINQEGETIFHNIEMAPGPENESVLNVLSIGPGQRMFHTNTYLRLPIPQTDSSLANSNNRLSTLQKHSPTCKSDVLKLLSDTSCPQHNIFRTDERAATIAIGLLDCVNKTWTLYADNTMKTTPLVVLPLDLKKIVNCAK